MVDLLQRRRVTVAGKIALHETEDGRPGSPERVQRGVAIGENERAPGVDP